MNCINHPDRPAVAQCVDCGRGLCQECAGTSNTPLCPSCARKRHVRSLTSAIVYLVILAIIGIIGYNWDFMSYPNMPENGLSAYMLMAICTGLYLVSDKSNLPITLFAINSSVGIGWMIGKFVMALVFGILLTWLIIIYEVFQVVYHALKLRK